MRAYVHRHVNGKTELGTQNNWITKEYVSKGTLVQWGVLRYLKIDQVATVELFYNFDQDKYGVANETFEVTKRQGD